ncbi:MAG: MBL fold metallo-hydrolase [Chloroflexota bacterium]
MRTAPNPGPKTLEGTNSFLVVGDHAYFVDPGPEVPPYQRELAGLAANAGVRLEAVLLTHGHPDHAPGAVLLSRLTGAPVLASRSMPEDQALSAGAQKTLGDGDRLPLGREGLEVLTTPGHTADHLAFWAPEIRTLFVGDTVLGSGTSVVAPPEGDMTAYMKTLHKLAGMPIDTIAPGHGPLITDPSSTLKAYLEHRRQREEQILQILSRGPASVQDLVTQIYRVDESLMGLAALSVEAQLAKLVAENRVEVRGRRYFKG